MHVPFKHKFYTPILATILVITIIIYHFNTKDIKLKIAYKGAGPQNYVAEKLYPENFKLNWEAAGVGKYDFSLPMRVYFYLAKYCGISPTKTMYPYMFFQTLLFLLSVAFLTQTLFKNKIVTFIAVVVIPLSNLAGLNLSRFGNGFGSYLSFPLFYAYANAFRIFALGFFLKNRYISMFIFLALSLYCHVNMGFYGLAFIGSYLLFRPKLFCDKTFLAGIVVFLFLVVPHILYIISNSAISSGMIPPNEWVKATRIFSVHWYPVTMRLFTINAHREFFPLLLLCFFFFMALKYQEIKDEKNLKIFSGTIICVILSLLGIIFSDFYSIPFLIKMSFQRSSELITFFGVLYVIYYLFKKVSDGNFLVVFIAGYSLLSLVFANPGIVVFPFFLLLYSDIAEGQLGPININNNKRKIAKYFYLTVLMLLLLVSLMCIYKSNFKGVNAAFYNLWTPLQYFNPFYGFDFLLRGGSFKDQPIFAYLVTFAALFACAKKSAIYVTNRMFNHLIISVFIIVSLSAVWYLERNKYVRWHKRYAGIASAYLDVQLWAKNNTAKDALFMPDPSHHYGWRDFSERSSFGNLREWGYTNITYNPDYSTYQEGLKRMKEFGIDMEIISEEILKNSKAFIYGQKLAEDIRMFFYSMNSKNLRAISSKHKIDYFIMKKKNQKVFFDDFEVVYENKFYIVYKF